jgi:hypothetical protein
VDAIHAHGDDASPEVLADAKDLRDELRDAKHAAAGGEAGGEAGGAKEPPRRSTAPGVAPLAPRGGAHSRFAAGAAKEGWGYG